MLIYAFEFNVEAGSISKRRVLVDLRNIGGLPDGMVIE